ncbi:MAG: DUF1810 domain-containing protein [Pseudomonadota bacterium]|jgi:uncharacterized protein (DUF1810 family)|nr:DUF1810 domain-containing protein [Pseudomonadota bacterium]
MADADPFAHFLTAQEDVFDAALAELNAGRKRGHWMWFVFPQIAGLGSSEMARRFALSGEAEARAFAKHPILGDRLDQATEAMLDWAGTMAAEEILGPVDAMKFRSSMTLFEASADDTDAFTAALDQFYEGERDALTLQRL